MNNTTYAIAQINGKPIRVIKEGNREYVAIKPICEILGINYTTQIERLKEDPILNSLIPLKGTIGADNKKREMSCIPFKYVFGWLFKINPSNVHEKAKDNLIKYQKECYEILYKYQTRLGVYYRFKEDKSARINEKISDLQQQLNKEKKQLRSVQSLSIEEFEINQSSLFSKEEMELAKASKN
jgi:hypothetical protein